MADALCGPSNALQNLQKHTSVDRSLQHDRLNIRQLPSQGFRSSAPSGPSRIDAEFQAFHGGAPLNRTASPLHQAHLPRFAPAAQPQLPNWASDFQKLNLSESHQSPVASQFSHQSPLQRSSPVAGWHQEFMQQHHQTPLQSQQFNNGYMNAIPQMTMLPPSSTIGEISTSQMSVGLQANQQLDDVFDDAAFARAFDAAQQEAEQIVSKGKGKAHEEETVKFDMSHACTDPGDVTGDYDFDVAREQLYDEANVVDQLRTMRRDGGWEALTAYEKVYEQDLQQTNNQRSREIVDAIRSMRAEEDAGINETELPQEQMKIGADTIPAQTEENLNPDAEAEALSRTAGQLLDNLKDEHSNKFQQSSFMELMRQLRDKEVRVEGDKMVNVSTHLYAPNSLPSQTFADGYQEMDQNMRA